MAYALRGSHLKVERANKHIKDLYHEIAGFRQANQCPIFVEKDAATGENVLKARFEGAIPNSVALIASDILHNLRNALDYIAHELVRRKTSFGGHISFPIAATRKKFETPDHQAKVRALGIDAASIIHALQPYKGGYGSRLFELHRLNIRDKHERPIELLAGFGLVSYEYVVPGQERFAVIGAPWYYSDAKQEIEIDRIVNAEFYHEPYASPDIAFAEIVARQEPINETVFELFMAVNDAIKRFEPLVT